MAIEKKLIHFGKLADFEAQLTAGNILDRSIVFIQDAKKIWTHGTYYDCSEGAAAGDIVQSDWNESDSTSDAFVKNRTHYADFTEFEIPSTITTSTDTFISYPATIGRTIYARYTYGETATDETIKMTANDNEVHQLGFGPVFKIRRGTNGVYVSGTYDAGQKLYLATNVVELGDIYIPDTVVRTDGVKTVNGQSLIGDGNVELALGDDNVQSDWTVSNPSSDAYVKNRTHYYKPQGSLNLTLSLSAATQGTNIFQVYDEDNIGFILNGVLYTVKETLNKTFSQSINGPMITYNVVQDGGGYYVQHINGVGSYPIPYIPRVEIIALPEAYIPETIARTSELKTINGETIYGGGDITIEGGESSQPMVSTTWAELKEMRDSASLVAGTWYRITDYVTTTSQSGTRSLEHPFDVIVLATGADTLSEEARAARHEGDVSVSVSLMGMSFFYKGVLTVDGVEWFEFENPEFGSLVTYSATPAIGDIVYPYVDGMVATEEAYPIESVSESENEYFLNNNANLDAWKIWYCLDNDKVRFSWAVAKTKKSIVVTLDEATLLTAEYNGTYGYEGIMYYRWDAIYIGMVASFLTLSDAPQVGDAIPFFGVIDSNMIMEFGGLVYAVNEPSENEGLGVIYRMIDEQNNDIPYDFKNIQFVRKVTLGKLDLENGTDEFVFTFNSFNENTGRSSDYSFNRLLCTYNNIKSSPTGLNDIVFLNESTSIVGCYSNTFGDNCYSNTFGQGCYSNTFGDNCNSNTFGNICHSNTFEKGCYSNTFGHSCYYNTFGHSCYSNTFGQDCYSNTFGDNCNSNTFGESADALVFGVRYYTLANNIYGKFLSVEGNRGYETKVAYNSIGELKMYCEADLAD